LAVILGLASAGAALTVHTARRSRAEREAETAPDTDAAERTESRAAVSALTAAPVSPRR
jgi:hypothetical protein